MESYGEDGSRELKPYNSKGDFILIKALSIIMCMSLLLISGCGTATSGKPATETTNNVKPTDATVVTPPPSTQRVNRLDSLKKAFSDSGLKVGDNEVVAYQMLGANNGYKFKIDGGLIEIYEYDLSNLATDGKSFIDQAKKGSVSISGFNVPVKYNNGLMIDRYDEHSEKDKILKVFDDFKG